MNNYKNQHYVPQSYLRQFTDRNDQMWVFDKIEKNQFQTNIDNVACERYFYDIPKEISMKDSERQIIEKTLQRIDYDLPKAIEYLIQSVEETKVFEPALKFKLAYFVHMQRLRTRSFRENNKKVIENAVQKITDRMKPVTQKAMPDVPVYDYDINVSIDEKMAWSLQTKLMFDEEMLNESINVLSRHVWTVGIAAPNHSFYTSDNSVAMQSHIYSRFIGIKVPGIEISCPISPQHTLLIFDRTSFRKHEYLDCRTTILDEERMKHYNCLQFCQSHRQIYSLNSDFSFAEYLCQEYPSYCKEV